MPDIHSSAIEAKKKIALRLQEAIEGRGTNPEAFFKKLGYNGTLIRLWMSGTNNFKVDTLVEFAFVLQVPLTFFFSDEVLSPAEIVEQPAEAIVPEPYPEFHLKLNTRRRVWELSSEETGEILARYASKSIAVQGGKIAKAVGRGKIHIYDDADNIQTTRIFPVTRNTQK